MYARTSSGEAGAAGLGLSQIDVGLIPERPGQLMRLALQTRFEGAGDTSPRLYDLSVSLSLGSEAIAIERDTSSTRNRVTGSATWSLISRDSRRSTLAAGFVRAVDGYNVINSQYFAADQENDEVQRRLVEALADQMTLQISAYFNKAARVAGG